MSPTAAPPLMPSPGSDSDRSRLWLIPLACLVAAVLLSLTAFWAMAARDPRPLDAGRGDDHGTGSQLTFGPNVGPGGSGGGGTQAQRVGVGSDPSDGTAGRPDAAGGSASTSAATQDAPVRTGPATGTPSLDDVPPAAELGFTASLQPATPAAPAVGPQEDTGGGSPATFFGQPGRGSKFVYVIDKSGSMQGGRFEDACFELIRSIRSLRPHESFFVFFYDTETYPMPVPGLVSGVPANQEHAIEWVRSISIGGGTDPSGAMTKALAELNPDTIWLLSDGDFDIRIADTIREANRDRRAKINTIAFHEPLGEVVLKRIAEENEGDYRFIPASP